MQGTVQFDGTNSDPFSIKNGVKQGCVLAPTLFGIFFSLLLKYAFDDSEDGVYIHSRSNGGLFNLARLRSKTKVLKILIRELLFADDAALATHSEEAMQRLISRLAAACNEFGLTISLNNTEIMLQDVNNTPNISIDEHTLNIVKKVTYHSPTIANNFSLVSELSTRIGTKSMGKNMLTVNTKMQVYQAVVLSTLLYGSESWTLCPPGVQAERFLSTLPP